MRVCISQTHFSEYGKYGDMLIGLMLHKNRKFRDFVWLHMEIGVVHTLTKTHTHTQRLFCCLNCSDSTEHKAEIGHLGQQIQAAWSGAAAAQEIGMLKFF